MACQAGGLGGDVVHAGDHEGVASAFEQQMAVAQRLPAQLVHQVDPALGLAVVLVVAGDVDAGPGGSHGTEGEGLGAAAFGRAVRDVAGVADQVGFQGVHRLAHPCRPAGAVERAVVGVGDEGDAEAVQPGAQPGESHVEPAHARHAAGFGVPPGEEDGGGAEDGPGDDAGPVLALADAGHGQGEPQEDAEQNGPGEQNPARAQQGVTDDRRPVLPAPAVTARHRERHTDETEDEQGGADQRDGQRPVLAGVQEHPAGHGPEQDGGDQGEVAHQAVQSALPRNLRFTLGGSGVAGVGHASVSLPRCRLAHCIRSPSGRPDRRSWARPLGAKGAPWRQLPPIFGPCWQTAYRCSPSGAGSEPGPGSTVSSSTNSAPAESYAQPRTRPGLSGTAAPLSAPPAPAPVSSDCARRARP